MHDTSVGADIWYLYHSGFAVATPRHFLIFDYWRDRPEGTERGLSAGVVEPAALRGRDVLVFVSHGHGDHLNPVIFSWQKTAGRIRYILSDDFRAPEGLPDIRRMGPDETCDGGDFTVRTLPSTDIGVAFLIEVDGLTIFHAGDLNWWHWEGEPDDNNRRMGEAFRRQIDRLRDVPVDLSFFPLDPRLEAQYAWGLDYFMRTVRTDAVFPMHFGDDFSVFGRICRDACAGPYRQRIVEIARRGQSFHYRKGGSEPTISDQPISGRPMISSQ